MNNEASIEIDRPIDQVFKYTNEHVDEWSIIVVEDEVLEDKNNGGVGTKFRVVTEDRGKKMEFQGVTTHWEPPKLSEVHMVGDYFDIIAEYRFEDLGGRTRVTVCSSVKGKGFTSVMFFLFGWLMKKSSCDAQSKELESLKSHAEQHISA